MTVGWTVNQKTGERTYGSGEEIRCVDAAVRRTKALYLSLSIGESKKARSIISITSGRILQETHQFVEGFSVQQKSFTQASPLP